MIDPATPSDKLEVLDKFILVNLIFDFCASLQTSTIEATFGEQLAEKFYRALYFDLILTHTSLFFFKSTCLFTVLERLSRHPRYMNERDFWLKSEDLVLRVKNQYDTP